MSFPPTRDPVVGERDPVPANVGLTMVVATEPVTVTALRTEIDPVTVGVPEMPTVPVTDCVAGKLVTPTDPVTVTVFGTVTEPVTVGVPTMEADTFPGTNWNPPVVTAKG